MSGIEITNRTVGIWIIDMSKYQQDWFGSVSRKSDGCMNLTYRFRYHVDDKTFDSADPKSWYSFEARCSESDMLAHVRTVVATLAEASGGTFQELLMEGLTTDQFIEKLSKLPSITMKVEETKH